MPNVATDPLKTARDKTVDELSSAFDDYFKNEMKRIDAEAESLRKRKSAGAAASLAKANASVSKLLLIHDISTFLSG